MRLKFCKKAWVCLLAAPFFLVSFAGLASCKREEERSAYHISAEYVPAAGILYGEMTVEVPNLAEEPKEEVRFALYPNAFREEAPCPPLPEAYFSAAYYEGESFGGIDVRELTGAKAWEVSEGGEALTVTLSEPLALYGKSLPYVSLNRTYKCRRNSIGWCIRAVSSAYTAPNGSGLTC